MSSPASTVTTEVARGRSPHPERRRDRRLTLALPVEFSLAPGQGCAPSNGTGLTCNVSSSGLCFQTQDIGQLEPGVRLELRVWLPQRPDGGVCWQSAAERSQEQARACRRSWLSLEGQGQVLRIERGREGASEPQGRQPTVRVALRYADRPRISTPAERSDAWQEGPESRWARLALAPRTSANAFMFDYAR